MHDIHIEFLVVFITILIESQLISKGNFDVFNSSKKQTSIFAQAYYLLWQKFIVQTLEELKKPKSRFEIN